MKKNYIGRGIKYLQNHDVKSLILKMQERLYRDKLEKDYDTWAKQGQATPEDLEKQRAYVFEKPSTFSIVVPLYHTPEKYLREMIESVIQQSYPNWELCLADGSSQSLPGEIVKEYQEKDSRIKYKKLSENKGISENTNEALNMAEGDFIALFDHDDLLEPDALFEVMKVLEEKPNTDIVYTDEDKIQGDSGILFGANFKPDYDLELLRTNNYICHFFVVRRNIIERVGGFRGEFDGAQDYDFIFRCVEATMEIYHIRKVLYHWRTHAASTAASPESKMYAYEAAKRAIQAHFKRMGMEAEVITTQNYGFFNYNLPGISKEKVKVLRYGKEDNGENLNKLAQSAKAEVLIFVPKDVEFKTANYETILSSKCLQRGAGAVGCLQVKSGKVKEAGLVLEKERIAVSYFGGYHQSRTGYFHRLSLSRGVSAVSGVFAIKKDLLRTMEGFAPNLLAKAAQIELCIRMSETGYKNIYTPLVKAIWYQNHPAGVISGEDKEYLLENYEYILNNEDPYYSQCCEKEKCEYGLRRKK